MGILKNARDAKADRIADDARAAADEGLRCFIYWAQVDTPDAVGRIVSAILESGRWALHSTAGAGTKIVYTFTR